MGDNHRSYQGNPLSINGNRSLSFKALLDQIRTKNNYRHLPFVSQAKRNILSLKGKYIKKREGNTWA